MRKVKTITNVGYAPGGEVLALAVCEDGTLWRGKISHLSQGSPMVVDWVNVPGPPEIDPSRKPAPPRHPGQFGRGVGKSRDGDPQQVAAAAAPGGVSQGKPEPQA